MIAILFLFAAASLAPIDPGSWVTSSDYPAQALAANQQGRVSFRLSVDRNGKPIACGILMSSGSQDLDSATCELLLARAQFRPALGADGRPVRSSYSSAVSWMVPNGPEPWASHVASMRYVLDATGAIVTCTASEVGSADSAGCTLFGQAGTLARLVSTPLNRLREIKVRIVQAASGQPPIAADVPAGSTRTVVAQATLAVDQDGKVTACKSDRALTLDDRSLDLCAMAPGSDNRFVPDTGSGTRTMQTTIEVLAIPR